MGASPSTVTARAPARPAERLLLTHMTDRLAAQFPDLSRTLVAREIRNQHQQFAQAPVRDFVPVLVERRVRTDLRYLTAALTENSPRPRLPR